METVIFTPRHSRSFFSHDDERARRLKMEISKDDRTRFLAAAEDEWVRIHDHVTGKDYEVKSAPCGLSCHCDAVYQEVEDEE